MKISPSLENHSSSVMELYVYSERAELSSMEQKFGNHSFLYEKLKKKILKSCNDLEHAHKMPKTNPNILIYYVIGMSPVCAIVNGNELRFSNSHSSLANKEAFG